jgi:hypothetical protein
MGLGKVLEHSCRDALYWWNAKASVSRGDSKSWTTVLLLWAQLCFDFVAIVSQRKSASDGRLALALAREAGDSPLNISHGSD